jgi:hypothetical protein
LSLPFHPRIESTLNEDFRPTLTSQAINTRGVSNEPSSTN